jgi:hypothetical protein
MPEIVIRPAELAEWGAIWRGKDTAKKGDRPEYFAKKDAMDFGKVFDKKVGAALGQMLGGVRVVKPKMKAILPPDADCAEVGPVCIVGGVRSQAFDVGYRPDGVRFAFDSKTLNEAKSLQKNYQNMVNDLATEATTVHTRFPYAVVAFMVICPKPVLRGSQKQTMTETLERLTLRDSPQDEVHKAEAIALILWDPETGSLVNDWPLASSPLRLSKFSQQIEDAYVARYKGLPPHASD